MYLWLDDIRDPRKHGCGDYVWAKTYHEAIAVLQTGQVTTCSLDHDLNIEQTMQVWGPATTSEEKTGYDVLRWLEQNPKFIPPDGIRVHSLNPSGRLRMEKLIERLYGR